MTTLIWVLFVLAFGGLAYWWGHKDGHAVGRKEMEAVMHGEILRLLQEATDKITGESEK